MNKQTKKRGRVVSAIRINNTGRIVFNQEGAERIGRPKYMKVIIDRDNIRLVPTDEVSDNALVMSYPKDGGLYISEAQVVPLFKPLGFEPGTGNPPYPIDPKPFGDDGFEFPSPFRN